MNGCLCECKVNNSKAIHNEIDANVSVAFGCLCECKVNNSKAIHNIPIVGQIFLGVVYASAKLIIRKQFTTVNLCEGFSGSCLCECKVNNSKAIHNRVLTVPAAWRLFMRVQS